MCLVLIFLNTIVEKIDILNPEITILYYFRKGGEEVIPRFRKNNSANGGGGVLPILQKEQVGGTPQFNKKIAKKIPQRLRGEGEKH